METSNSDSFLVRHEFLLRRLHSLSGLIPVGAFMVVHLTVNASVLNSAGSFQKNVHSIHSLGALLPLVEWVFIFLPILFHAIFGVVIIRSGLPNQGSYPTASNYRYTLQRVSGMIAFVFILWHVFHMHGWFHFDWWRTAVVEPLGGAKFAPFRAASTASMALSSLIVRALYAIGVLACVYHLANGIWTMGITWGVWISADAQRKASAVCAAFGVGLALVGLSSLWGLNRVNVEEARQIEDRMFEAKLASGELPDTPAIHHKRGHLEHEAEHSGGEEKSEEEIEASTTRTVATALNESRGAAQSDSATSQQQSP